MRDGGVVGMQHLSGADVAADGLGQGIQQEYRSANPVGQGRAVEFDAFAGIDAGLAVQRCMVAELRHQNLREQARARPRSIGELGIGGCTIVSQARQQLSFGQTMTRSP